MKITHRAPAVAAAPNAHIAALSAELAASGARLTKAPHLSCCCRLSELLPLVRQLHDAARAAQPQPGVAA